MRVKILKDYKELNGFGYTIYPRVGDIFPVWSFSLDDNKNTYLLFGEYFDFIIPKDYCEIINE